MGDIGVDGVCVCLVVIEFACDICVFVYLLVRCFVFSCVCLSAVCVLFDCFVGAGVYTQIHIYIYIYIYNGLFVLSVFMLACWLCFLDVLFGL